MTFIPTKLGRDDFPPSVPVETVDRILAIQETRDRVSWWLILSLVAGLIGAIGLMMAAAMKVVPPWATGVGTTFFGVVSAVTFVLERLKTHRLMVEQGFTCPKCGGALFTNTWSGRKQQAERDALLQERCLRCFEHIEPRIMATVDELQK